MEDSELNPMKTGLVFVPPGLATSPGHPAAPRTRHHLTELLADFEAAAGHGADAPTIVPEAPRRPALRRLLECLGQVARWRQTSALPLMGSD